MWEEEKSRRFQQLRQLQQESRLNEMEQTEFALMLKELEDAEAAYLTPATEQLRQERATIEGQMKTARQSQGRLLERLQHLEEQVKSLTAQLQQLDRGD